MFTLMLKSDQRRVTLDIPEEYLNRTLEVMIVPVPDASVAQRREALAEFFAKHQTTLGPDWKSDRGELNER